MKVPKCLICYTSVANSLDIPSSKIFEQLRVIFILRDLLHVPNTLCEKFLSENGNPSCWVNLCSCCCLLIDDALFIHAQINELHQRLQELSSILKTQVKKTKIQCPSGNYWNETLKITQEVRDLVAAEFSFDNNTEDSEIVIKDEILDEGEIASDNDGDPMMEDDQVNHNDVEDDLNSSDDEDIADYDDPNDSDFVVEDDDLNKRKACNVIEKPTKITHTKPSNLNSSNLKGTPKSQSNKKADKEKPPTVRYVCNICDNAYGYDTLSSIRNHRRRVHDILASEDQKAGWKPETIVVDLNSDKEPASLRKKNKPNNGDEQPLLENDKVIEKNKEDAAETIQNVPEINNDTVSVRETDSTNLVECNLDTQRKRGPRTGYDCNICGQSVPTYQALADHKKAYHFTQDLLVKPPKLDYCEFCNKKYDNYISLRSHRLKVHNARIKSYRPKPKVVDPEPWKCFECVEKFALETERDDHFESSHPEIQKPECPATCVKCKKGYISKMELRIHYDFNHKRVRVENEDETKTLRCDKCKFGRRYATEEELQFHIRRTHDGDKVPYKCLTCAKGCHSPGALRIHMQKHTGERLFMCEICSKKFRQNKSLIFHLIRDHKQEAGQELDSESLRCDECDKLFSSKQYVRHHKLTVHEKKFKHLCNICGMGTQNASNLKVHMKTHDKSHIKSLSKPRKQLGGNRVFKRKKTTHSTNIMKRRNARKRKSPTPSSSEQDESEMEMDELDTHSNKEMQEEKTNIPITKQEETSVPVSELNFDSTEVCDFDGSSLSKVDDSDYLSL